MRLSSCCALPVLCGIVLLCARPVTALPLTPGTPQARSYISSIDNSAQPYTVYVPTPFDPAVPHPIIFHLHAWKGHATTYYPDWQKTLANNTGYVLVQPEGRGNCFYDGIGEVDLVDVLADLRALFTVDDSRLFAEGSSMGATGAYRQGIRHPDLLAASGGADGFADYREWYRQYYTPTRDTSLIEPFRVPNLLMSSCLDVAEGATWHNMHLTVDGADGNVWPENTYHLDARLNELGAGTPDTDYRHLTFVYPTGGHGANYNPSAIFQYFLDKQQVSAPAHVVCKTTRLKYGTIHWVTIDRLRQVNTFGIVDGRVTGNQVVLTATNVRAMTLRLGDTAVNAGQPVTVTVNGVTAYTGTVKTLMLHALIDDYGAITGWSETDPDPTARRKTAALEGPIGDAYTKPFLVVYGTTGTTSETSANLAEANDFCQKWLTWMGGSITPRTDVSITANEQSQYNLILFGNADTNQLINASQSQLPIAATRTGVAFRGRTYADDGSRYGVYYCYPNPAAPSRYLVISHLQIPGATVKDLEALPWYWPDYVIFDTTRTAGTTVQSPSLYYLPDTFVESGYFDEDWSANTAPAAVNDLYVTTANTALTVAAPGVLVNDTDPDGDILTATQAAGPAHGTLALHADGSFTYTPAAGFHGADTFTYRAGDGGKTSYLATVTITVTAATNHAPVAMDDSYTAAAGTTLIIDAPGVLGNDSDIDGDPVSVATAGPAAHGEVMVNSDGSFTYTPNDSGVTQDSFTYQVTDGRATSNTATVTINFAVPAFEGDVTPRPQGDGALSVTDWVQAGRFAAGLDAVALGDEFQRADCAPRLDLGDGLLTVSDWVQAGRYAAGLDPLTTAGGPTGPNLASGAATARVDASDVPKAKNAGRGVSIEKTAIARGATGSVRVVLDARGDESAVGCSLRFDPRQLNFVSAQLHDATGTLLVADARADQGIVGLALMLPVSRTFPAGRQPLLTLTFRAPATAPAGMAQVAFIDQPVRREVADVQGVPVDAAFSHGQVRITGK